MAKDTGEVLQEVIGQLISKDNSSAGDYYDDEHYLVCGKCHERKQYEVAILGKVRRVPIMCSCEKEAWENEQRETERREAQMQIERFRREGITDPEYLKWRIETDDRQNPKLSDAVIRYTENWAQMKASNMGILFYGPVGTGKTFFAACIANRLLENGVPVMMTNIPALMSRMSNNFEQNKSELLGKISRVPLLVIDDLGSERDTSYGNEKLFEIIDTRYRAGKPLIVTTNLSPDVLNNPQDIQYKRVYDRVLEMCKPIKVSGESRRKKKAMDKWKEAENLLDI